jgi:hypothetical protein
LGSATRGLQPGGVWGGKTESVSVKMTASPRSRMAGVRVRTTPTPSPDTAPWEWTARRSWGGAGCAPRFARSCRRTCGCPCPGRVRWSWQTPPPGPAHARVGHRGRSAQSVREHKQQQHAAGPGHRDNHCKARKTGHELACGRESGGQPRWWARGATCTLCRHRFSFSKVRSGEISRSLFTTNMEISSERA